MPPAWEIRAATVADAHAIAELVEIASDGVALIDWTRQAADHGYERVSLVAFEENRGALRLYERLGYAVVARAPVVPHPLIRYAGDALLMVARVTPAAA